MRFLRKNKTINGMLKQYEKIINGENQGKNKIMVLIPAKFDKFVKEYFVSKKEIAGFEAEVEYLFLGCENKYDLCHKMYPFWSGSIIADIYSFMESTEQIQGNYELKEAEFGQLKHSLNVNDELALHLFHIIRFKLRTVSWKQIYGYFKFLLRMKYNVQRAILKSKQAEDTTVSLDGIKMTLEIQLNDEGLWLFHKVDELHGSKVTWKQISKYLKKMVAVRDEMRDFFHDNKRDRVFEDNKAEIVNSIHSDLESNIQQNESLESKLIKTLDQITKRLDENTKRMDRIDQKLESIQFNLGC